MFDIDGDGLISTGEFQSAAHQYGVPTHGGEVNYMSFARKCLDLATPKDKLFKIEEQIKAEGSCSIVNWGNIRTGHVSAMDQEQITTDRKRASSRAHTIT